MELTMRNMMLTAVAAFALIGGGAFAQTDDTGTTAGEAAQAGSTTTGNEGTNTSGTDASTTEVPAADATTTSTMTTQPMMAGGTIGQSVTDSSGTVVGVVSDLQLNADNTIQGIIIKDSTGSFVVTPERLMRGADGSLMINATADEIRTFPMFGGDGVGDAKGGEEESGRAATEGEEDGSQGEGGTDGGTDTSEGGGATDGGGSNN
jgi:sporulation protein YlmC with PRC-barrel domain